MWLTRRKTLTWWGWAINSRCWAIALSMLTQYLATSSNLIPVVTLWSGLGWGPLRGGLSGTHHPLRTDSPGSEAPWRVEKRGSAGGGVGRGLAVVCMCVGARGVFLSCEGQDLKGVQPSMKTAVTSRMNVQMWPGRDQVGWWEGWTQHSPNKERTLNLCTQVSWSSLPLSQPLTWRP